jgi:hypothetical protein
MNGPFRAQAHRDHRLTGGALDFAALHPGNSICWPSSSSLFWHLRHMRFVKSNTCYKRIDANERKLMYGSAQNWRGHLAQGHLFFQLLHPGANLTSNDGRYCMQARPLLLSRSQVVEPNRRGAHR